MTGLNTVVIELMGRHHFDNWKIVVEPLVITNDLWEYVDASKENSREGNGSVAVNTGHPSICFKTNRAM